MPPEMNLVHAVDEVPVTEPAVRKHSGLVPFRPGQSGNPKGRPKGSRNRLGEAFLQALQEDFDAHGSTAIAAARELSPLGYLRVVASLMPREVSVTSNGLEALSDAELEANVIKLVSELGLDRKFPAR